MTFAARWAGLAGIIALRWRPLPWAPCSSARSSVVHAELIQGGLDHPWDIAFTDDGRMLVTERIGRVRVYASGEPGAPLLHTATIPDVRVELESGLMGIAIRDDAVFVCASRDRGGEWSVELLRSSLGGDSSLTPFEVVPIGEMTGAPRHQGCAVEVDGSDHIWLSVGDANLPAGEHPAQDPDRLNGKVLRINLDGSVPADNPFGNAVYSLGHRNPQGLAFAPDGAVWEVEHGTDENDEVNLLQPGGNYGYPCFTGADATGPIPDGCGPASDYLAPAWASGSPPSPPPVPRSSSVLTGETGRAISWSARSRKRTCDASRWAPMARSPWRRRCWTIGSAAYGRW